MSIKKVLRFMGIALGVSVFLVLLVWSYAAYIVYRVTNRLPLPHDKLVMVRAYKDILAKNAAVQQLQLKACDGVEIAAYAYLPHHPRAVFLFCHGLRQTKEFLAQNIELFPRYAQIAIDFRNHGESGGRRSTIGIYEAQDVAAAVAYIQNDPMLRDLPLIGVGFSMGGASLINAAARGVPFDALIIEGTFANLEEQLERTAIARLRLGSYLAPFIRRSFKLVTGVSPERADNETLVSAISVPIFFIVAAGDDVAPVSDVRRLYVAASGNKRLWITPGTRHRLSSVVCPDLFKQETEQFVRRVRANKQRVA